MTKRLTVAEMKEQGDMCKKHHNCNNCPLEGICEDNIEGKLPYAEHIEELQAKNSDLEESCVTSAICIKEILESYINFIDIVLNKPNPFTKMITEHRMRDWKPELDKITKDLQAPQKPTEEEK